MLKSSPGADSGSTARIHKIFGHPSKDAEPLWPDRSPSFPDRTADEHHPGRWSSRSACVGRLSTSPTAPSSSNVATYA